LHRTSNSHYSHKCNQSFLRSQILNTSNSASYGDDELAHTHAYGTHQEKWSSAPALDKVKTRESAANIDARGNERDCERILDSRVGKELTSPLALVQ
jgi:hypothetical protein